MAPAEAFEQTHAPGSANEAPVALVRWRTCWEPRPYTCNIRHRWYSTSLTLGVNDGARIGIVGPQRRRQVQPAGPADRRAAAQLRPRHPAQRIAGRRTEPGGHPRPGPHRRLDTGRRPSRTPVGRRRPSPRCGRRAGVRHRLGCNGFHAQRRPAATCAAGQAAGGRMGRDRARRAHQPPRHRGHHLAGRPPTTTLGAQHAAGCCW